jgi:ornithine cyclodeaminase/alanine dehydrogenase-like protein (mu-crystallin family)
MLNYLSFESIDSSVTVSSCINCLESLFKNEAESDIEDQPKRSYVRPDDDSVIFTMPALSKRLGRFCVKVVSEYKRNPSRFGLPVQGGAILLFDSKDSRLLAVLDSAVITEIRTGAVCAVASKFLSREDSTKVGVIGCGRQARRMLEGACAVRKIQFVTAFSRDFQHASAFADEMASRIPGVQIKAVRDRATACREADILIVATNSSEPAISWKELSKGTHINSIGTLPERRELDEDTIFNSSLYVDNYDGVLTEAGDVMAAISSGRIGRDHIRANLSKLVKNLTIGRRSEDEVTLFKSVGFALLDLYASDFGYEKAIVRA